MSGGGLLAADRRLEQIELGGAQDDREFLEIENLGILH